jgi:hypothetical protein
MTTPAALSWSFLVISMAGGHTQLYRPFADNQYMTARVGRFIRHICAFGSLAYTSG